MTRTVLASVCQATKAQTALYDHARTNAQVMESAKEAQILFYHSAFALLILPERTVLSRHAQVNAVLTGLALKASAFVMKIFMGLIVQVEAAQIIVQEMVHVIKIQAHVNAENYFQA
jgi:hypothetical protein